MTVSATSCSSVMTTALYGRSHKASGSGLCVARITGLGTTSIRRGYAKTRERAGQLLRRRLLDQVFVPVVAVRFQRRQPTRNTTSSAPRIFALGIAIFRRRACSCSFSTTSTGSRCWWPDHFLKRHSKSLRFGPDPLKEGRLLAFNLRRPVGFCSPDNIRQLGNRHL